MRCSENLLPKAIPHNYHSRLTWRVRNSPGCCPAFLSAAKAPGVATIWPSSKAGCLLICCILEKLLSVGLFFACQRRRTERRIKSKCPSWRGEALGRPRCQGRVVFAFIGAKRRALTEAGGSGAGFASDEQLKFVKRFLPTALSFKKGFSTRTLTEFAREPLLLFLKNQLNVGHPPTRPLICCLLGSLQERKQKRFH